MNSRLMTRRVLLEITLLASTVMVLAELVILYGLWHWDETVIRLWPYTTALRIIYGPLVASVVEATAISLPWILFLNSGYSLLMDWAMGGIATNE